MFLKDRSTGDLVEVLELDALINPTNDMISAKNQAGQEEQEPASFQKNQLTFPSGESLPRCWLDADYTTA